MKPIEPSETVNKEGEINEDLRDFRFVAVIEGWEMELNRQYINNQTIGFVAPFLEIYVANSSLR